MRNQHNKLRQYQKRIVGLADREKKITKECLQEGQIDKGKLAARRTDYQESLLVKINAQVAKLERLTSDIEFALVQKGVLYGLQQGTTILKEIHEETIGIGNVEKLLAENKEARTSHEVRLTVARPTQALYIHIRVPKVFAPLVGKAHSQGKANDKEDDELAALRIEASGIAAPHNAPVAKPQSTLAEKVQMAKDRQ
jgi:charged multivesicular body protein 6